MLNQDYIRDAVENSETTSLKLNSVLRTALDEYVNAGFGLMMIIDRWQQQDESGDSARHNAVSKSYPFQQSFDELVHEVSSWSGQFKNEAERIEFGGNPESVEFTNEEANYLLDALIACDENRQQLNESGNAPRNSDGQSGFEETADLHSAVFDKALRALGGEHMLHQYTL